MSETLTSDSFPTVVDIFRRGDVVIIVDDQKRENEGDLAVATEHITPEILAFMMREARGLICTTIGSECSAKLQLPLQYGICCKRRSCFSSLPGSDRIGALHDHETAYRKRCRGRGVC